MASVTGQGIAIRRENLEHGVRQALISMDLGLEARAESDLNQSCGNYRARRF